MKNGSLAWKLYAAAIGVVIALNTCVVGLINSRIDALREDNKELRADQKAASSELQVIRDNHLACLRADISKLRVAVGRIMEQLTAIRDRLDKQGN